MIFVILLAETFSAWFNSMYYAHHQLLMLYQHWVGGLPFSLQLLGIDFDAPDLLISNRWARPGEAI